MRSTERLTNVGIEPLVGSKDDSYGNTLAGNITASISSKKKAVPGQWHRRSTTLFVARSPSTPSETFIAQRQLGPRQTQGFGSDNTK